MHGLELLNIDLKGLTTDALEFSQSLDDEYFRSLDGAEIKHGQVEAHVLLNKAAGGDFALTLSIDGTVTVTCDLCLDDMDQHVEGEASFVVKLGTEASEDDQLIVVDENQGILSLGWIIYETIALAIPIKHVHAPGKCNAAMTEKLKELSPKGATEEEESATRSGDGAEDAIDPRWQKLKDLKS
ncbi:MAG: DUF177 domain-containing protein [Prevotella sp.]|nr:DUF177 domain-containing protein [Prevotella sp.]